MPKVNHVASLVRNLENSIRILTEGFGFKAGPVKEISELGIRNAILTGENVDIELIQVTGPGPYWEFVQKDLMGLNHIAVEVDDLPAKVEELSKIGVKPKGQAMGVIWNLDPATTDGVRIQLLKRK